MGLYYYCAYNVCFGGFGRNLITVDKGLKRYDDLESINEKSGYRTNGNPGTCMDPTLNASKNSRGNFLRSYLGI